MSATERLLSRLDGVRQTGDRWRADCPIGHRSRGTLSITSSDDGTVLLRCWAGCDALVIVQAVGLELRDLFPDRLPDPPPRTPAERREQRDAVRMRTIRRKLPELALESRIVLAAAAILGRGERLALADEDRLVLAVERIGQVREVLR